MKTYSELHSEFLALVDKYGSTGKASASQEYMELYPKMTAAYKREGIGSRRSAQARVRKQMREDFNSFYTSKS